MIIEIASCEMSAEPGRKTAYTPDIGWRVVWRRIGMEQNFSEIAEALQIASSTAHRIYTRFRVTGDVAPRKQPLRRQHRKLDDCHELLVMGIVLNNPCIYLREVCIIIKESTGVQVSGATVCRVLRRNGFTRKKVQHVAKQRCIEYRAQFRARSMLYRRESFVWIDESGSDARKSMRKFGYSFRGYPPINHRFLARRKRVSAIAAISCDGLLGVELTTGSVDGGKFIDFVRGTLIPNMHPFDGMSSNSIVVMDNCAIHHVSEVYQLFEDTGILVLFLPPYSPDMNPIEEAFSSVKYFLQDHDELLQAIPDPKSIIQAAFDNITKQKCEGWIKDCGY